MRRMLLPVQAECFNSMTTSVPGELVLAPPALKRAKAKPVDPDVPTPESLDAEAEQAVEFAHCEFMQLFAGQAAYLAKAEPAATITTRLMAEANALMKS